VKEVMQIVKKEETWVEERSPQKVYPETYRIRDVWTANVDLLKNLLIWVFLHLDFLHLTL